MRPTWPQAAAGAERLSQSVIWSFELNKEVQMADLYVFHQRNEINNAVWHGDSLTYGQNGSNPGTPSATRLAVVLNAVGPTWQGTNFGHPGHTITQMISELGSDVNGLYDGTRQNNYLIAQGGHNDIGQGADPSTVISRIQSYCSTALSANPWKIIWSTEPPAVYPPNFDSIRDTVNSYMRQNWQSLGIAALSDFALDPRMGCDGCEYNSTYYGSDHTHPTDAGYTIWGSYDLAAVNSLNGSFQRVRTQTSDDGQLQNQASGDGQLWYSVFDGTNWATDTLIPNLGMSESPSAALWKGGISVFHQGSNNNGQLWYTFSSDGKNWGNPKTDAQVLGRIISASPSCVVFSPKPGGVAQCSSTTGQLRGATSAPLPDFDAAELVKDVARSRARRVGRVGAESHHFKFMVPCRACQYQASMWQFTTTSEASDEKNSFCFADNPVRCHARWRRARAGNAGNGTKVERRVEYAECFECNRPTSGCQRRHWLDNRERL